MYSSNQRWHATGIDWPRHRLYCSQRLPLYPPDSLASDWTFVSTQQQSWASSAEAAGSKWCCCEQTTGLLQGGRSSPAAAASTNFMALLDEASHPLGLSRWSRWYRSLENIICERTPVVASRPVCLLLPQSWALPCGPELDTGRKDCWQAGAY